MRKVFEPNSLELADLGGDTHFVMSIQRQVEEMLTARGAECQEVQQKILALGPRALPGVVNAAYVFTKQLEKSKQAQMLSDLLAGLVGQNLAAREILVKAGILEAPFIPTRETALKALQQLGEIRKEEMEQIRLRAWNNACEEDYRSALILYEFLVQQEDQQACSEVRYLAKDMFKEHVDIGPHFLDLALRCACQDTYAILTEVMGAMKREATEFGLEMQNMSLESVANLPEVLRAANKIKETTGEVYAHKGIENLFTGPIKKYLGNNPEVIEETGKLVRQEYKSLSRFLWQCLGRLLGLDTVRPYFVHQMTPPFDEFALEGAVQLFYVQERNTRFELWATELLEKLEENAPDLYQGALYEFGKRSRRQVKDIISIQISKRSMLVKDNSK